MPGGLERPLDLILQGRHTLAPPDAGIPFPLSGCHGALSAIGLVFQVGSINRAATLRLCLRALERGCKALHRRADPCATLPP